MESILNTYILFPSHSDGLALEKVLKYNKIKYTITPTPRELSKCCGISIMIDREDINLVEKIISGNSDIKTEGIHTLEKKKRNWFV